MITNERTTITHLQHYSLAPNITYADTQTDYDSVLKNEIILQMITHILKANYTCIMDNINTYIYKAYNKQFTMSVN